MKDMSEGSYVLRVKILRDRSRRLLGLSQETYIKKVLERFQMQTCKPVNTPLRKGSTLSLSMYPQTLQEKEKMARIVYSTVVGSLMYAMMCTQPDICHAIGLVSRFQANPIFTYWKAVKQISRYLKGITDYMLYYQVPDQRLVGYNEADWGRDPDGCKSTSGYTFLLNDGAITWCSKKQTCIALSTMEAEYVVGSATVQEGVWLRRFLQELGIVAHAQEPITIYCDSSAAIAYSKDPKYHGKTKYIGIRYHLSAI